MGKGSRLQAFTLLEMLAAMALISVVVMFSAYGMGTVRQLSADMREGLSVSESTYFIVSDMESRLSAGLPVRMRFSEVAIADVTYDLGLEWSVRWQHHVSDTFPVPFTEPMFAEFDTTASTGVPIDVLTLRSGDLVFPISRGSSIADMVNTIVHGQD